MIEKPSSEMTKSLSKLIDCFYNEFVQRDFLGYILPGYIVLLTIFWSDFVDPKNLNVTSTSFKLILLLIFSLGIAYIIGLAVKASGTIIGIIIDYPLLEEKEDFHNRLSEFKEKYSKDHAKYIQRERYIALKQASGNCAVSFYWSLLLSISLDNVKLPIPWWLLLLLGVLLTFCHWQTTYNQYSFEMKSVGKDIPKNPIFRLLSNSILEQLCKGTKKIFSSEK